MVAFHLFAQQCFTDDPFFQRLVQQAKEKTLLVRVRVGRVTAQEGVFTEQARAQAIEEGQQRVFPQFVRGRVVDRQAGLLGLGPAFGIV